VAISSSKSWCFSHDKITCSEWAKYGIRSNAIGPGPFPTEGVGAVAAGDLLKKFDSGKKKVRCKGRVGEHQELANILQRNFSV